MFKNIIWDAVGSKFVRIESTPGKIVIYAWVNLFSQVKLPFTEDAVAKDNIREECEDEKGHVDTPKTIYTPAKKHDKEKNEVNHKKCVR